MKTTIQPRVVKLLAAACFPILVLVVLWNVPVPEGLSPQAWQLFAIFAATICGILTEPLPPGAVMFVSLAVTLLTRTLPEGKALAGFANGTVWLIFCAFILSIGFVKSGLGRRIAYKMLSLLGGSSLGIAYSLGFADLLMSPAMPSVTARSGGIIAPVSRSINEVLESRPGPTGRKIGEFLTMYCFQITPITGAIFLTGMAANPLAATLAKNSLGLEISWMGWFVAAVVPMMVCFAILPLLLNRLLRPELQRTPEAKQLGLDALRQMGPMSVAEKKVAFGFLLALVGWGTSLLTNFSATTVAIVMVAYLFLTRSIDWKDVLAERPAWDTLMWFGVIVGLATGLSDLGFIKWMTAVFSTMLSDFGWLQTFVLLGLIYIYAHYVFATATGHTAALYAPFAAAAIAAGAPPMMVAIAFGIFSNLMWSNTEYGGGPGPIYFGQGYFKRPRFYRISFLVITLNVAITFTVGLVWWKIIGHW